MGNLRFALYIFRPNHLSGFREGILPILRWLLAQFLIFVSDC